MMIEETVALRYRRADCGSLDGRGACTVYDYFCEKDIRAHFSAKESLGIDYSRVQHQQQSKDGAMAYNRTQARAICSDSEYELFTASLADSITQLTPTQLRGKIKRARTLRDKSSDLFRRQSLAMQESTGNKRGKTGSANQRTEQKARLFDEVLKRFEARLDKITAEPAPAAKKAPKQTAATEPEAKPEKPAKATAPSPRKAHTVKGPTKATTKKAAAGPSEQLKARTKVQVAHKRASTARSQAKRDKR